MKPIDRLDEPTSYTAIGRERDSVRHHQEARKMHEAALAEAQETGDEDMIDLHQSFIRLCDAEIRYSTIKVERMEAELLKEAEDRDA